MKKNNSINFVIDLTVYPFDVMVSFGETNEQMAKRLSRYKLSDDDVELAMFANETVQGRSVMFGSNQSLIRLRHIPETAVQYANLSHEIFHCVSFIMWKIGMPLEINKSCEAYAYLIEYITKKIYEKI
jgi:hypothetical protein